MGIIGYVLSFLGLVFIIFIAWIFKIYFSVKKNKNRNILEIMHFKSNEAAFEMSSKYMNTDIVKDRPVIALSVQKTHSPNKPIMIKVSGDPPFFAHASTAYVGEHIINDGDLLGVIPFKKAEHITSYMEDDERKQWLFLVVSELNPSYHNKKQMWSIKNNFVKEYSENTKKI